ncbi:MAG: peptidylprolyl isomerase [Rikenellaceae bacterium]|nr:peptidylprolyl isomerase [Rikenellaceae bacterium]
MKYMKSILALALVTCCSSAMAQQIDPWPTSQRYVADEVVAVVGSSMVLLSDLRMAEDYIKQSYIERGYTGADPEAEALETILVQKLLASQAAIDSLTVNTSQVDDQVEAQIDAYVRSKGSVKAVEEYFNRPIFSVRDHLRRRLTESEMARAMKNKVEEGATVTPSEVLKFVRHIPKDSLPVVPDQYVYAQVVKYPSNDDDAKLNVKEQLLSLRDRIMKGTSFAALARMYSEDYASASRGGEMDPQSKDGFVSPFAEALEALKPGQVSEIVETEFGYHIIELLDVDGDLYHCRHILMRVRFDPEDRERALTLLDSVVHQVRVDSLSFDDAVKRYSDDVKSKQSGGIVANSTYDMYNIPRLKTNRFFRDELGIDYEYLRGLEPGQMSDAFESIDQTNMNELVKFVKLVELIPSHVATFEDDYTQLEDLAVSVKKQEIFDRWLDRKIDEMYVKIEAPYDRIKLSNPRWKK